jgi:hypothetical protein
MIRRMNAIINKLSTSALAALVMLLVAACFVRQSSGQNRWVMDDNQFNQWVFNENGGGLDEDSEVTLMVESIDRACHLTPAQKEKIQLGAHGDYARFKEEIDELRAEFVGKAYDQNDMNKIWQKISPVQQKYQAGLLGEKSLFAKVVQTTLTPEQHEEFDAAQAERRKAKHAAKVRLFVAMLDQSCPMKASQRDAFVELLLKDTKPALRTSEYDWYVVIVQVAKLPDKKLTPILDSAQLKFVKKVAARGRGMEAHLIRLGVLPK